MSTCRQWGECIAKEKCATEGPCGDFCKGCASPVGCAGAGACLNGIAQAVIELRANRMEIIQNGTCAYMSPRPYGLWVSWHLAEKLIKAVEWFAISKQP